LARTILPAMSNDAGDAIFSHWDVRNPVGFVQN